METVMPDRGSERAGSPWAVEQLESDRMGS